MQTGSEGISYFMHWFHRDDQRMHIGQLVRGLARENEQEFGDSACAFADLPDDIVSKYELEKEAGYRKIYRISFIELAVEEARFAAIFNTFWEFCFNAPMGILVGKRSLDAKCLSELASTLSPNFFQRVREVLTPYRSLLPPSIIEATRKVLRHSRLLVWRGHDGDAVYFLVESSNVLEQKAIEHYCESAGLTLGKGVL